MMNWNLNTSLFTVLLIFCFGCTKQDEQTNVMLLTLDTLRADAVGCYGNESIHTPNLDRLAAEGVLFEDTICQIPATLTSHTAIMTGLYPRSTGVRFRTHRVPDAEHTLAEVFNKNGYRTAAFISSYVLEPAFGLKQGFDVYDLGSMIRNGQKINVERRAEETISDAIQYIEEHQEEPLFVWVHLYDPHTPYDPPPDYSNLYDPDYEGSIRGTVQEITKFTATKGSSLSERDLQHLRALYDGEVSYMDHHIGRLFQKMEETGILDQTIVAAIADHGEAIGEHGQFFHGDDLYQSAVRIPFMIRYPKQIQKGLRVPNLVQSIDLFPTLIEMADLQDDTTVEGRSLVPLFEREKNTDTPFEERPGFLETEADMVCESNKLFGMRTGRFKFINQSSHRRPETPLGVFTEIPLKGPSIVFLRIKGDSSVQLMVHIRYRTQELYASRDFQALSKLNTTIITAETLGVDPLHRQAMQEPNFLETPNEWRLQVSPDLYRVAYQYGKTRGWPTDWMVIEGVGVDAGLPYNQTSGTFIIDQIELYTQAIRFPNSPRFRDPFWVIEDFESDAAKGLADAKSGPEHTTQMSWTHENVFGGKRQQKVEITFPDSNSSKIVDELYDLQKDPHEQENCLAFQENNSEFLEIAENCSLLLDNWRTSFFGQIEIMELDTAQREALESLGYTR